MYDSVFLRLAAKCCGHNWCPCSRGTRIIQVASDEHSRLRAAFDFVNEQSLGTISAACKGVFWKDDVVFPVTDDGLKRLITAVEFAASSQRKPRANPFDESRWRSGQLKRLPRFVIKTKATWILIALE